MEKSKEIRKFINLMESINDNIKTNNIELDEANPFGVAAREGKIIAKEIESVFNVIKSDSKISPLLTKAGVTNADEMLNLIKNDFKTIDKLSTKVGKLIPKEAGQLRGGFELGVLKSSTTNKKLIDIAAENLVKDRRFFDEYKQYANEVDLVKKLKERGYSDQAAKNIAKKRFSGKYTVGKRPIKPTTKPTSGVGTTVKKYTKEQFQKLKEFLTGGKRNWKDILKWGAGIGIGGSVLWYMLSDSGQKPDDLPTTPPTQSEWMPCIQKLISDKIGTLVTSSSSSEISVLVTNSEYPNGIKFYSNGRVKDFTTGKMGTYKCKQGQIVPQQVSEQLGINEQSSEISQQQMKSYVDDAVDDLDGYVAVYNLNNLKSYLTALKGKTYKGRNAIQAFLEFYKEDEGGDDFVKDVQSVGVKTLGVDGIEAKKNILSLVQSMNTPTTGGSGLDDISIEWDTPTQGGGTGGGSKKSIYHDCTQKDFPFEFGCINPKIGEIQECLGVTPTKGYFGPKTQSALNKKGYDATTITQETYDTIMSTCGGGSQNTTPVDIDPNTGRQRSVLDKYKYDTKGKLKSAIDFANSSMKPTTPTNGGQSSNLSNGEDVYKQLVKDGSIVGSIEDDSDRIKQKGKLTDDQLKQMDQFLGTLGYKRFKQKEKASYGVKYVWIK
jgi:hypothetical protein